MDPAEDLLVLCNGFRELQVGGGDGAQDEARPDLLAELNVEVYVAEGLSLLLDAQAEAAQRRRERTEGGEAAAVAAGGPSGPGAEDRDKQGRPQSAKARGGAARPASKSTRGGARKNPAAGREAARGPTPEPEELDPVHFLAGYLSKVARGEHVVGSRFSFVMSTPWNRISFARALMSSFGGSSPDRRVTHQDFLQLVRLLCDDFPSDLVRVCIAFVDNDALAAGSLGQVNFRALLRVTCLWVTYGAFFDALLAWVCPEEAQASAETGRGSLSEASAPFGRARAALYDAARRSPAQMGGLRPPAFVLERVAGELFGEAGESCDMRRLLGLLVREESGLVVPL